MGPRRATNVPAAPPMGPARSPANLATFLYALMTIKMFVPSNIGAGPMSHDLAPGTAASSSTGIRNKGHAMSMYELIGIDPNRG